jgi:hypothetical protein
VFLFDIRTHVARDVEGQFPAGGNVSAAICDDLDEARAFAGGVVARHPELCCEIFDHEGKSGAPLQVVYDPTVQGRCQGRPVARRETAWGVTVFACGVALIAVDLRHDLAWIWGYVIGLKMVLVGTGLLVRGVSGLCQHRSQQ